MALSIGGYTMEVINTVEPMEAQRFLGRPAQPTEEELAAIEAEDIKSIAQLCALLMQIRGQLNAIADQQSGLAVVVVNMDARMTAVHESAARLEATMAGLAEINPNELIGLLGALKG
jgi:hypothetical protein